MTGIARLRAILGLLPVLPPALLPALLSASLWTLVPGLGSRAFAQPQADSPSFAQTEASPRTELRRLEVSVLDPKGSPVDGLRPEDFLLLEDGASRPLAVTRAAPRHLLLLVDLPTSPLSDRHLTLPAVGEFLLGRAQKGDRITIAALGRGTHGERFEVFCRLSAHAPEIKAALDLLAAKKEASFQARRHRRTDIRRELRDAYQTLEQALNVVEGDGHNTAVLYLGRSLSAGIGESSFSDTWAVGAVPEDSESTDFVGSIQYLVSKPRSGPLESKARGDGDRLLAAALRAQATVFPLVAGQPGPGLGSELWLATETGGRPLAIRRMESELERLDRQLDNAYVLSFEPNDPADDRFHRLQVKIQAKIQAQIPGQTAESQERKLELSHLRGYQAVDDRQQLAARARAEVEV